MVFPFLGCAQDLTTIGQDQPVKITGGFSANQVFYAANGLENRRDPYNYFLGANINLDVYGLNLPFSFTYSNQESSFRQPFNQFSLNPSYKWITGHFGYASMSFSDYSLNGHIFEGAGLDLSPADKWEVNVMYGRLQRATPGDSSQQLAATYKRIGYGLKVKYGTSKDFVAMSLFRSGDDIASMSNEPSYEEVLPEENLVTSIRFSKSLFKKLNVKGEYAISMLTRDQQAEKAPSEAWWPTFILPHRTSSSVYDAYNVEINFAEKKYGIGLRYEQVGADYETHGAYYFNNNFNNLTLQSHFKLLRGKANTQMRLGVQSDNIDNNKMSSTQRWVGSLNINYRPSKLVDLGIGYSNFTSYTNVDRTYLDLSYLSPYDRLDTLNYSQVSQQANLNFNYSLGPKGEVQRSLMFQMQFMESHDIQGNNAQPGSSNVYAISGGFRQSVKPTNFSFNALINLQHNGSLNNNTVVLGPSFMVSKLFFERQFRTSASIAYNLVNASSINSNEAQNKDGRTLNFRLNGHYKLLKKHDFRLTLITVHRSGNTSGQQGNGELTGTLGYNFSF